MSKCFLLQRKVWPLIRSQETASKVLEYLSHLNVFVYLGPWQSQIVYVNNVIHGVNLGPCGISVISGRVGD